MRTTVTIDDELLDEARRMAGITEVMVLLVEGLLTLIERESARRLAHLGGSEGRLLPIPRRRAGPA